MPSTKIRHSISGTQANYGRGDKIGLERPMRAWKGVKDIKA